VAKLDVTDDRTRGQVENEHLVSIDARLSHTGAAVDGHKCSASIRRNRDFMTVNPGRFLCYGRNLSRGNRINDAQIGVTLVDYQQCLSADAHWKQSETKTWQQ
jgi:hypothetical protein